MIIIIIEPLDTLNSTASHMPGDVSATASGNGPLSEDQACMRHRLCVYLQLLPVVGRKPLRPLGFVPSRKLFALIHDMNQVLSQWRIVTFRELSDVIYCAARVVTDDCFSPIHGIYKPPFWRQRLQFKLQKLQKDLSQLKLWNDQRLFSWWKIRKLFPRYPLNTCSVLSVCEHLRQKIKVYSHWLQHYDCSLLAKKQNSMFLYQRHKFFDSITGHNVLNTETPPAAPTLEFWSSLWGKLVTIINLFHGHHYWVV